MISQRLWNPHPWRYSDLDWTWLSPACSEGSTFDSAVLALYHPGLRIHIITLGKIRVVGELREIKCPTVLETDTLILSLYVPPSHPPPGIPTTH